MKSESSFFSVRYDLIQTKEPLAFDLYINSSTIKEKEKYIRIFPQGGILLPEELESFHKKYLQLYIPEYQRGAYLKSLVKATGDDLAKTNVIKEAAIGYLHTIFDKDKEFSTEVLSKSIEGCRDVVESMVDVLDHHDIDGVRGLIANLSFHDFYTFDHSINVSMYCISIYKAIHPRAKRKELMHAGLGGLLHDLGKIKIPTEILNKPSGLSEDEYKTMKQHPTLGLELLLDGLAISPDIDLNIISRVIYEHHENFNGTGYPRGLKGKDEIHFLARICTIADFFDAITTKRSYNEVLSIQEAINTMKKFKAVKLDPDLFDAFENHVNFVKTELSRDLILLDNFDPTLPYASLPVQEVKQFEKELSFGKIKVLDTEKKRKKA
jgi:HD-GYP domain-containing protein (c-di-GMP phosphodiesterase class II)